MKHRETHPNLDVEGCFGCRVAGVSFGANESTTRGARVKAINQREKGWNRDMPAYKRLRQQGLQPRQIDGAALLESSATEKWQIEGAPISEATPVSSES
jgi:hypothetical protein